MTATRPAAGRPAPGPLPGCRYRPAGARIRRDELHQGGKVRLEDIRLRDDERLVQLKGGDERLGASLRVLVIGPGRRRLAPLDQRRVFGLGLRGTDRNAIAPPLPGRRHCRGKRLHLRGQPGQRRGAVIDGRPRRGHVDPQRFRRAQGLLPALFRRRAGRAQLAVRDRPAPHVPAPPYSAGQRDRQRPVRPQRRDSPRGHRRQFGPAEVMLPEGGERGPVRFLGRGHRPAGRGLARRQVRQRAPRRLDREGSLLTGLLKEGEAGECGRHLHPFRCQVPDFFQRGPEPGDACRPVDRRPLQAPQRGGHRLARREEDVGAADRAVPPALGEGPVGGLVTEPGGEHCPGPDPVGEPRRGREVVGAGRPVPPCRPDWRQSRARPDRPVAGIWSRQDDLEADQFPGRFGDRVRPPGARLAERRRRVGEVGDAPGTLGDDRGDEVTKYLGHSCPRRRVHAEHPVPALAVLPVSVSVVGDGVRVGAGEKRDGLVDRELLASDKRLVRRPAAGGNALRCAPVPYHKRLAPHVDPPSVHPVHLVPLASRPRPRTLQRLR